MTTLTLTTRYARYLLASLATVAFGIALELAAPGQKGCTNRPARKSDGPGAPEDLKPVTIRRQQL